MHYHGGEELLWVRISRVLGPFKSRSGQIPGIVSRLDRLVSTLKILDIRPDRQKLREALKDVVRYCAKISYGMCYGSSEKQLREIPGGQSIYELREVVQVKNLARYFGL